MGGKRNSDPHSILETGFDEIENRTQRRRAEFATNEQDGHFEACQLSACDGAALLVHAAFKCPGVVSENLALGFWTVVPRTRTGDEIEEHLQHGVDFAPFKQIENSLQASGPLGCSGCGLWVLLQSGAEAADLIKIQARLG